MRTSMLHVHICNFFQIHSTIFLKQNPDALLKTTHFGWLCRLGWKSLMLNWRCHSIAERQATCLSSNSPLSRCDPTEVLYMRPGGGVLVLRANLQVGFFWYRPNGWGLLGASAWFRKVFGSQQNTRRSQVPSCWVRTLACICRKQCCGHLVISAVQNASPEKILLPPEQPMSKDPKSIQNPILGAEADALELGSFFKATQANRITDWRPRPGMSLSFPRALSPPLVSCLPLAIIAATVLESGKADGLHPADGPQKFSEILIFCNFI